MTGADRGRLRAAADLLASHRFTIWRYGDSVGFEGLLAASDVLGDPRYEGWVHGALKAWAARMEPFKELDNTAPGHAMCLAFERTGDEAVLEAALRLAEFLATRRQAEGAFVAFEQAPLVEPHGGEPLPPDEAAQLADPGAGIFVDCMHFDPPFFTHLGVVASDRALVDLGAHQALAMIALLQDESGLFHHFWLEKTRERHGYAWARGQCWPLLGLLDVLAYLPREHDAFQPLLASLRRLAAALGERQEPDGGWPAVAGDPSSGAEHSTAAFAAAGFADGVLRGLLDDSYADRARAAWSNAWGHVDERGALTKVSYGIRACTRPSHYRNAPTGEIVPWGQGPLLLAAKRIDELDGRRV